MLPVPPRIACDFFLQAEDGIRDGRVTGVQTCALPILKFRWSSTARVHSDEETVKAMAEAGARLFIVGFESGDAQILKNIKKRSEERRVGKGCRSGRSRREAQKYETSSTASAGLRRKHQ